MSWIVRQKENAEAQGADPQEDMVMFAITPRYVGEIYNRYRNEVEEDHEDFKQLWEEMSEDKRKDLLETVERYIDKHMSNIDEDIDSVMQRKEREATGSV